MHVYSKTHYIINAVSYCILPACTNTYIHVKCEFESKVDMYK